MTKRLPETVQTAQQVIVHRMSLIDETDAASTRNTIADKRIRLHNIVMPMTVSAPFPP